MGNYCSNSDTRNTSKGKKRSKNRSKRTKKISETNDSESDKIKPKTVNLSKTGLEHNKNRPMVALNDYRAYADGELSLNNGETVVLIDCSDHEWLSVRNKAGNTGFVPSNLVAAEGSLECELWYHGELPRRTAEKYLSETHLEHGSFIVRLREESKNYVLSVRDYTASEAIEASSGGLYKHYFIKKDKKNNKWYIVAGVLFQSIPDMISHYKIDNSANSLCCKLTYGVPRAMPKRKDLCRKTAKNWEIPRDSIIIEEKVGQGHFGEVFRGEWNGDVEVAVKRLKHGGLSAEEFMKEATVMKQLDHENIVKLYGVCTDQEPYLIVTEFITNGALHKYLMDNGDSLDLKTKIDFCAQISCGMTYLEELRFVHRDLAARNVLVGAKVSNSFVVKIADFGLARILKKVGLTTITTTNSDKTAGSGVQEQEEIEEELPIRWTALESLMKNKFSVKSDVWSFGVVVIELFTKAMTPYAWLNGQEIVQYIENGNRLMQPSDMPNELYGVVLKCWDKDPKNRPSFAVLHRYFDAYLSGQGENPYVTLITQSTKEKDINVKP